MSSAPLPETELYGPGRRYSYGYGPACDQCARLGTSRDCGFGCSRSGWANAGPATLADYETWLRVREFLKDEVVEKIVAARLGGARQSSFQSPFY